MRGRSWHLSIGPVQLVSFAHGFDLRATASSSLVVNTDHPLPPQQQLFASRRCFCRLLLAATTVTHPPPSVAAADSATSNTPRRAALQRYELVEQAKKPRRWFRRDKLV